LAHWLLLSWRTFTPLANLAIFKLKAHTGPTGRQTDGQTDKWTGKTRNAAH